MSNNEVKCCETDCPTPLGGIGPAMLSMNTKKDTCSQVSFDSCCKRSVFYLITFNNWVKFNHLLYLVPIRHRHLLLR